MSTGRCLVRGGVVADGTGAPRWRSDVLLDAGRVTALGPPGAFDSAASAAVVDASGLVVAPGFVDAHSHADNAPFLGDDDTSKILQGVTTEVVGNCGFSLGPCAPGRRRMLAELNERIFPPVQGGWVGWGDVAAATDARGYVTNCAPLVGHGALRVAAAGMADRPVDAAEREEMVRLLDDALAAGAFGLSSGLTYPPGLSATTDELVGLAGRLPPGAVYATHVRDEGAGLLSSIDEALEVGRRAGCRVQVSHLKVTGPDNWGRVGAALAALAAARDSVEVHQDVYPYEASSTILSSCLPRWCRSGTNAEVLARLRDPATRDRLRRDRPAGDGDGVPWGSRVVVATTASHTWEGCNLEEVAAVAGGDAVDALVEILVGEGLRASMIHFCMSPADVDTVVADPATMIGSDGLPPGCGGRPHPRLFGTFPRVLGRYVRERGLLSLEEAVRKMTSLPADTFGLEGRGRVEAGAVADLVAFDAGAVSDLADYTDPARPPAGIAWVMQAGEIVVSDGRWLGRRRGRRLEPR